MRARGHPDGTGQLCAEAAAMSLLDQQIDVTCLECGSTRAVACLTDNALGICPTCGYVGWALAEDVNFADLRALRGLELAFAS
jgi:predicted RNA-binding Zn-ribbon protein involved in translation (DUF1610 family)